MNTWTSTADRLPPEEEAVLIVRKGVICLGERRRETPTFEETFETFSYWDDPLNVGQDWNDLDITHWQPLPPLP